MQAPVVNLCHIPAILLALIIKMATYPCTGGLKSYKIEVFFCTGTHEIVWNGIYFLGVCLLIIVWESLLVDNFVVKESCESEFGCLSSSKS